jgi:hypothetical protein
MGLPRRKTVMVLVPAPGRRRRTESWWSALASEGESSAGGERDRSAETRTGEDGEGAATKPSEEER